MGRGQPAGQPETSACSCSLSLSLFLSKAAGAKAIMGLYGYLFAGMDFEVNLTLDFLGLEKGCGCGQQPAELLGTLLV